jgi:hypothetical protein
MAFSGMVSAEHTCYNYAYLMVSFGTGKYVAIFLDSLWVSDFLFDFLQAIIFLLQ